MAGIFAVGRCLTPCECYCGINFCLEYTFRCSLLYCMLFLQPLAFRFYFSRHVCSRCRLTGLGARNFWTMEKIEYEFLRQPIVNIAAGSRTCIVFHCEFSSARGPGQWRHLRYIAIFMMALCSPLRAYTRSITKTFEDNFLVFCPLLRMRVHSLALFLPPFRTDSCHEYDSLTLCREIDHFIMLAQPHLIYPEMYVMQGGYKEFFNRFPHHCTPQEYLVCL
jgi:hypothetical protein